MMIPRKQTLSRRSLLRGAGVAIGLPWLEAMVPASLEAGSKQAQFPVRMAVLFLLAGEEG